ncbi:hypothetical protein BJ944DRAFT_267922 [Cunninghamella echinulata]|nr:hypothetical protein BJ944DRAFT_267922 [Cunninghamella echinulata]
MYSENEIYTTQIIIHPRVIQLQRVLTLDDYLQIQALLEYFQKRQTFLQENQHAQLRLARALNNIRLLKLEHRRQRANQLQHLLHQYHDQCYQYDRAKLICALEQRRAQLAFNQFLHDQQQQEEKEYGNNKESKATQLPEVQQLKTVLTPSEPLSQVVKSKSVEEEPLAVQLNGQADQQQQDEEEHHGEEYEQEVSDDGNDEGEDGDDYGRYQSQQLEELLKLLFEKHQRQEEEKKLSKGDGQQQHQEVYEPLYRQTAPVSEFNPLSRQTAPVSEFNPLSRQTGPISGYESPSRQMAPIDDEYNQQTFSDILPFLQQQSEMEKQEENKGVETFTDSDIIQPQQQNNNNKKEEKPLLPDHVTSLEDVLNQLVHTSTPTPPEEQNKKEKEVEEMDAENQLAQEEEEKEQDQEAMEKIKKLKEIDQRIDQLYNEHHDQVINLPLQYQMNDQGKLFLDGNTPDNRAFLGYEDDIVRCMLQLDNILSDGNLIIRNQRRQVIHKAETILEQLDHHKQQEWEKETRKQNDNQQQKKPNKKHRHKKRRNRVPVIA